jgi:phosphoserine phosphatase
MLRAVGHPRVVSPDPRLSRAARQGGWPILQW